jgi:RNA polymerase sigma-70 factor (ECF subfamily)
MTRMAERVGDPASDHEPAWRALVPKAQLGDRAARAALYEEFAPTVHAIALAHVGRQSADDVTQDVFCTVFASLSRLRDPGAFAGFLSTSARNASRDLLRRDQRAPRAIPDDARHAMPDEAAASPADAAEASETTERVFEAVQQLPEAYREPLLLRLVSGLSGTEIAARTGMTHGSVRVNLTRGMAMLRERLKNLLPEVTP